VELKLNIPNHGTCYVWLPLGTYDDIDTSGIQVHAPGYASVAAGQVNNEVINLDKGCAIGTTTDATKPRFAGASQGFPQSISPTIGNTTYMPIVPGESIWKDLPRWLNQLKATVIVSAADGTVWSTRATLAVDGMQLAVKWHGRPAPPFPNGCDSTQ